MKHISWNILKYISIKWNAVLEFNHNTLQSNSWCNKYLVQWSNTSARGFPGRSSNPWSLESHNALRLPAKIAPWNAESTPRCFIEHHRFATVLDLFVGQLDVLSFFLPSRLHLLLQLLRSRSQHAVSAVPWAPLPLSHVGHQIFVDLAQFCSKYGGSVESHLWFLPRAIDSTRVHK